MSRHVFLKSVKHVTLIRGNDDTAINIWCSFRTFQRKIMQAKRWLWIRSSQRFITNGDLHNHLVCPASGWDIWCLWLSRIGFESRLISGHFKFLPIWRLHFGIKSFGCFHVIDKSENFFKEQKFRPIKFLVQIWTTVLHLSSNFPSFSRFCCFCI